ncbi:U-box domain-containing protein [Trifolium repens]|nr:U-box domain-containing protein [Trifolium repens]
MKTKLHVMRDKRDIELTLLEISLLATDLATEKFRVFATISTGSQPSIHEASLADYKVSNAFLFPGQGAQAVGIGKEAQNVPSAAVLYKKANEILGFDLLDVCINGPKEKMNSTVISQPALYVTSLAAVELLRAREGGEQIFDSVDVTCCLSLGEYTALAFAGAFSFEDGLKLVKLRGEAMQDASDAVKSAMAMTGESIVSKCQKAKKSLEKSLVQIQDMVPVMLAAEW